LQNQPGERFECGAFLVEIGVAVVDFLNALDDVA
jgi:hypothetical protein